MPSFLPILLDGLRVTAGVAFLSAIFALVIAFTVGLGRLVPLRPLQVVLRAYVEIFRGTSALIQLFYVYFVFPLFGLNLEPFPAAVIALSLNTGAYGSEIVRSSVLAVSKGQREAASVLGLPGPSAMRLVLLPQAVPRMLPPFGNLLVEHIKITSLVSLITVTDLAFAAQNVVQAQGNATQVYLIVLALYFVICFPVTQGTRFIERTLRRTGRLGEGQ